MFRCCHINDDYIEPYFQDAALSRPLHTENEKYSRANIAHSISSENSDITNKMNRYPLLTRSKCINPSSSPMPFLYSTERKEVKPFTKLLQKRNTYLSERKISSPKMNDSIRKRIGSLSKQLTILNTKPKPEHFFIVTPSHNSHFKFTTTYFRPRNDSTQSTHITIDSINSGRPLNI